MRIALTYLTSFFCHAAVLTLFANIGAFHAASDYTVRHGSHAVVLQASTAASESPRQRSIEITAAPGAERLVDDADSLPMPRPEANVEHLRQPAAAAEIPSELKRERVADQPSKAASQRDGIEATSSGIELPHFERLGRAALTSVGDLAMSATATSFQGAETEAAEKLPSNPQPPYPADALRRGIEGLVQLHVCIAADGRVENVSIHQSSGVPALDQAALTTVRQSWRFRPAMRRGEAVASEAILPIRFTIRAD